ncbi:hypothetical protein ACFLTI_07585 [Bacteroidota bacterium]
MDFNLDNLFLIIGIGAFLISVLFRKKKLNQEKNNPVNERTIRAELAYAEDVAEVESIENTISDFDILPVDMTKNSYGEKMESSEIFSEQIPDEKETNDVPMYIVEEKDVEGFDLRKAVIMSTILQRKYI